MTSGLNNDAVNPIFPSGFTDKIHERCLARLLLSIRRVASILAGMQFGMRPQTSLGYGSRRYDLGELIEHKGNYADDQQMELHEYRVRLAP